MEGVAANSHLVILYFNIICRKTTADLAAVADREEEKEEARPP